MLTLFHNAMSTCSQKVRFALHEKNLDWEGVELDLRRGDQLKPDYLKINPKGLVPALVHDGHTLVESNVIIEYLNEAFPEPDLMSASPIERARARRWMKRLDDGLHLEIIALSVAIAFRFQLIEACGSAAVLDRHLANIPDPYIREIQSQVVKHGVDAPRFAQAVVAFEGLLRELERDLADNTWIIGNALGLADIAYAPYITRLEHLHLREMWCDKPNVARWFTSLKASAGYQAGISSWFNPKFLPLMDTKGSEAWPKIQAIIGALDA